MIRVHSLTKRYSKRGYAVEALSSVDLHIHSGELAAIVGRSGSGKSTLMNILGLLDRPSEGEYYLRGRPVAALSETERAALRNRTIGFVFQGFNLLPRLTALQNVALPLCFRGIPAAERLKRAELALRRVGLYERMSHRPSELSGGQQQRVAIARALAGEPALILADEPTGNLDHSSGAEVLDFLCGLNRAGVTVVLITHDDDVAARASRVIELADGRIV